MAAHPKDGGGAAVFVLSSPSGAGKSTLARMLIEKMSDLSMSVSVTTRAKRPGEIEGSTTTSSTSRSSMHGEERTARAAPVFDNFMVRRANRLRMHCRPGRTCCSISTGKAPAASRKGACRCCQRFHPAAVCGRSGKAAAYPRAGSDGCRAHEPRQPRTQSLGGIRLRCDQQSVGRHMRRSLQF